MTSTSTYGITGFGGYIPRLRMERSAIAAAHIWMAPSLRSLGKGQRAFCSWDEDSVTMAVEAARDVLAGCPAQKLSALYLSSSTMPFADLQNSAIVAGALNLGPDLRTLDAGSSQRSGTSALLNALRAAEGDALLIASERPKGKPASTQEINYGAGAAAFTLGNENVIATLLGSATRTTLFVDHFRANGAEYDYVWEERWIRDEGYMKLVPETARAALAQANVTPGDVKHLVMPSPYKGIAGAVAKKLQIPAEAEATGLDENCGFTGAAHGLLMLAHVLEKAAPGDIVLLIGFGQGCDAIVLRVNDAIRAFRPRRGVDGALADAQNHDAYLRLLSYEGGIAPEWGMRAEKNVKTALTEQYRSSDQLSHFVAGKCRSCNAVQFPQLPYCVTPGCNAPQHNFDPISLVDEPARVLTHTADWLSYHPAPPLYVGFVQFENGARLLMEVVDVGKHGLDVGTPLRMVFRIKEMDKTRGYPRYFWKATPVQA
ncbi:hydroxymethylglutaryl-CoA synthase family protein [Burkholderia sp. BCC1972]|uniref:hydroxymethylglutaryl-CoA synthase family protein n=1 Tax=Burkholderia sp. BCC1972 TaxID=2817438 RepID=UPI002ABE497B|nr:3-oxoacyl-[acyl-carrier-protein] synthase III C-terminal domain-containing protein [Burkholderia sp. BCC1972]